MKVDAFKGSMKLVRVVKGMLEDIITIYGCATVADYYDIIGVTSKYSDDKIGWTTLRNTKIAMTDDDNIFELQLPMPYPLE